MNSSIVKLFAALLAFPLVAHADCSPDAAVRTFLCASYDFGLPINVAGIIHSTIGGIQFPDGSIQTTAATGSGGSSQWTSAGNDISYSAGRVGVGTITPDSTLTVAGLIHATAGGIKFPDGSTQTSAVTQVAPSQWTTSGTNISYSPSTPGNVGIGTTTPGQMLSVAGTIESTTGGIKFPDGSVQTTAVIGSGGGTQWTTVGSSISYSGGNVGLGTTAPNGPLTVVNSGSGMGAGIAYNIVQRSPTSIGTLLGYDSTNSAGLISSSQLSTGGLEFFTYSGSFQERMRITGAGNVGIGTGTPSNKLSVTGVIESSIGGFKFPDGTTQTTASFGGGGSSQWTTAGLDISYSTGKVGVGTSAPSSPLTVAGIIESTTGGIKFPDGSVQTAAATTPSPQWSSIGTDISYSSGNVGIGTVTPDSPLTVAGNLHLTSGVIKFADGSSQSTAAVSGTPSQWTTSGSNISYASGLVGIGTTTPDKPLTVAGIIRSTTGGIQFPDGSIQTVAATGGGTSQWTTAGSNISYASGSVGVGTTSPNGRLDVQGSGNTSATYGFGVRNSASTYSFAVRDDGNIGVGTITPNARLDVQGPGNSSATFGLGVRNSASVYSLAVRDDGNIGVGTTVPNRKLTVAGIIRSTTGGIEFPDGTTQTSAATGGSSQWTTSGSNISYATGNVGVGTLSPASPLTVAGVIESTAGGIKFPDGTTQTTASTAALPQWAVSGTDISYSTGKVGVGTSTPASPLTVAGIIESTTGGIRFPDGSTQTTAATSGTPSQWTTTGSNITYAGGQVGIGTTTTDAPLTVGGPIHMTSGGIMFPDGSFQTTAVGNIISSQWTNSGSNIYFSSGAVGIGTFSPTQPLTVAGIIRSTAGGIQFPDGSIQDVAATNYWNTFGGNVFFNPVVPGNIGVGTSTPGHKLSVNGQIESMTGGYVFPDGSVQTTAYTASGLSQWSNYSGGIGYNGGTVGIGTTAPVGTLDVYNVGTNVSGTFNSNIAQENFSSIGTHLGNDTATLTGVLASSSASSGLSLGTTSGSYQERIRIANNGNVGIGISTPTSRLTVNGAVESTTGGFKFPDGSVQLTASTGGGPQVWQSTGDDIYFLGGLVGIGTNTPQRALHLTRIGTDESKSGILFTDDASGNYRTNIIPNFSVGTAANNKLQFLVSNGTSSGQVTAMVLTGTGAMGVGTATPSYKLDVAGTMRAYGITDASDVRLKKNISPLTSELQKILRLVAVNYQWKNPQQDTGNQIGLIAQDVEKVYPELVKTDSRGMKSVNYSHLVAPLAQAVKELSAQNADLIARLERLEKKMETK